jgi:cell division transport system permease protein
MSLAVSGSRHLQALFGSLGRLARNPLATLLTLLVIAVALALPTALRLLVSNAQTATGNFVNAIELSVYLKTDVPLAKAQQLAAAARQRADVAQVRLISAQQGLEDFRNYSGFGDALAALKENPLPNMLHVRPRPEYSSSAALDALRRYFTAWPEVDLVQVDSQWVMRFNAILQVLRQLLLIAAALLGVGVLAVVGNTIRLEIAGRRAEIEVTKLVGGSNSFVRRPFLYTGVLYGLGGALLAWGIIAIAVAVLGESVANLARLYGSRYVLAGPSPQEVGVLLGSGVVLGWLGAWLSATRHLRSIEPRAD